jgi:HAMP domain-containing protein
MIWIWVAIGIVVLAIVVLAIVALGTFRRLRSLQVAVQAPDLPMAVIALQGRMAELQDAAEDVQQLVQVVQERLETVKASRTA